MVGGLCRLYSIAQSTGDDNGSGGGGGCVAAVNSTANYVENTDISNSAYCGMPAGLEAFRVADRVLGEMEERGEIKRE